MLKDDSATAADESGLDGATIERVAEMVDVELQPLATALVILHAELIGRHSNLEHSTDYVTVDGTRAYRVHESIWNEFLEEFDFTTETELAVRLAHTEQAKLLFAKSIRGNDNFAPDEEGVVIGIDTAEQF